MNSRPKRGHLGWALGFMAAAGCACPQGGEPEAIRVVVNVPGSVRSTHVCVVARSDSEEQTTTPLALQGRTRLVVALFPGGPLGKTVAVSARGYDQASCTEPRSAQSPERTVSFARGRIEEVVLSLEPVGCTGEGACAAAACDGQPCDDQNACTEGDRCQAGTCQGAPRTCAGGEGCFAGACAPDAGCLLLPRVGRACDGGVCQEDGGCENREALCGDGVDEDQDGPLDCLDPDCEAKACGQACWDGAVCAGGLCDGGAPRVCTGPNECFLPAGCSMDEGCLFSVAPAGSACGNGAGECRLDGGCPNAERGPSCGNGTDDDDDGRADCQDSSCGGQACDAGACVVAATCGGDVCQGTARVCPPALDACRVASCNPQVGCGVEAASVGTPCDGGTCAADGGCQPGAPTVSFPFTPTNFNADATLQAAAAANGALLIDCAASFDSSPNAANPNPWCPGQRVLRTTVVSQPNGPDLVVIPVSQLQVADAGVLHLAGTRPVAFAVFGDAVVSGQIQASASGPDGGVGAGGATHCATMAGKNGESTGNSGDPGGAGGAGGAGHGTVGGTGGRGGNKDSFGNGGLPGAIGGSPTLSPLVGGCPGGQGGVRGGGSTGAAGGGGGGAVQVSVARRLIVRGSISVGGGGGRGGTTLGAGGGAGGSGGAILLEGDEVGLGGTCVLAANGGAGGGGDYEGTAGGNGEDALISASPAAGGTGDLGCSPPGNGCRGGAGAAGNTGAADGTRGKDGNHAGGGGAGGGAGRIRLRASTGCAVNPAAVVSGQVLSTGANCP